MSKSAPNTPRRGRPSAIAPDGYLTIARAAELAGASYSTVYRLANEGAIRTTRRISDEGARPTRKKDAAWFVRADEVAAIKDHLRSTGDGSASESRPAVMVRPNRERLAAWQKAADKAGADRLSQWLMDLADKAAGVA